MKGTLYSRRQFAKLSVATAAGLAMPYVVTPKSYARDAKLVFWLQPNFNQAADDLLVAQTKEYAKSQGLSESDIQIETIPGGEVNKRMAAALEIGAPPDVTRLSEENLTAWGSAGHLLDVTPIVNEMKAQQGGINENSLPEATFDGGIRGVPMGTSASAAHFRVDKFHEAGYDVVPDTWDEFIEACRKITKPPFYGYGMALGLTPSDSLGDVMSVVNAYGGALVNDKNLPAFESDGAVQAFKLINAMYNEYNIIPKGVVSWDNSGNNKAFLAGQIGYALNETSIYSTMITDNNPLAGATILDRPPGGPAGRFSTAFTNFYGVFKQSPNPDLAMGLVSYFLKPENYSKFIVGAGGRYLPIYPAQLDDPFWAAHPAFNGLKAGVKTSRTTYSPGKPSPALAEIVNRSLIVAEVQNMLVKGKEPAKAVADAQKAMIDVFKQHGEPV